MNEAHEGPGLNPDVAEMERLIEEEEAAEGKRKALHQTLTQRLREFLARSKGAKEQVDDTEPSID